MKEIVTARDAKGGTARFLLDVFQEADRFTATLVRIDEKGQPMTEKVAPRFYGLTAEQARRRMLAVLENQYEETKVQPAG